MKESMWGYYLILLGIMVSTVMILMSNMVTSNQQDYYLLKEVTNASMHDSIDWSYYKKYGEVRINTEKFVEVFIRRFAETVSKTNTYKLDFYSVYENPPSVSIRVTTNTGDFNIAGDATNIDVVNSYDAILESNNNVFADDNDFIFYSIPYGDCSVEDQYRKEDNIGYCAVTNKVPLNFSDNSKVVKKIRKKIEAQGLSFDKNKIKILDVKFLNTMSTKQDLENYSKNFNDTYDYTVDTGSINKINGVSNYGDFFAKIENVRISVVDGDNGKKYLTYGLDYSCDGVERFNENHGVKPFRKKASVSNYLNTPSEYLDSCSGDNCERTPYYNACMIGIKYKIDFYYDYD